MLGNREYSPPMMVAAEPFTCMDSLTAMTKRKNKNKRRFSDDQIKSLETMFELESRLEPHKKLKLAGELGLQPRQVAIWFQNKRARWKSKQLERDYNLLRANYNSLASMFEAVKREKQALVAQLQKLNDLMQTPEERQCCRLDQAVNSAHSESGNGDTTKCESDTKPTLSTDKYEEQGRGVLSDEETRIKEEHFGQGNEPNLLNMVEVDSSITSPEDWGSWNSDGLFNLSTSDPQWLDFWS